MQEDQAFCFRYKDVISHFINETWTTFSAGIINCGGRIAVDSFGLGSSYFTRLKH